MAITNDKGQIVISTKVDESGLKKGLKGVEATVGKIGKLVAGAFSVAMLVKFSKQALDLASDLTETQNVVDTAFGSMSYKIEEFSKTCVDQFGISELTAKQMASTFAAMGTGLGQSLDVGTDKAVELTGRLADVASFYNKSTEQIQTIGRAIYSGETEPLKALGIIMTQDELKAYAMEKGFDKAYDKMSSGEKVLVRQQFFLDKTALAAGDFAKTADSWANQTRILSERWKSFLTVIGNGLITVLTPAIKILNQLVGAMTRVASSIGSIITDVFGLQAQTLGDVANSAGIAAEGMEDFADATQDANKATKQGLADYDKLSVISTASDDTSSSDISDGGMTGLATSVQNTQVTTEKGLSAMEKRIQEFLNRIKKWVNQLNFKPMIQAFKKVTDAVLPLVNDLGIGVMWLMDNILLPFAQWKIESEIPAFLTLLAVAIDGIRQVIEVLAPIVGDFYTTYLQPIVDYLANLMIDILNDVEMHIQEFADMIKEHSADIEGIVDGLGTILTVVWEQMLRPQLEFISGFISGLVSGIVEVVGHILTALSGLTNFIAGVFTSDWKRAWNGILDFFKGIVNSIIALFETACNSIIKGLNKMSIKVPDWVPEIGGEKFGFNLTKLKLPRLAQGAVIPPNREFMAILGDQKQGTNIETPLATMIEAFKTAIKDMGGTGNNGDIVVEIDGVEVFRAVRNQNDTFRKQTGKSAFA